MKQSYIFCLFLIVAVACKKPCQNVLFDYHGTDLFFPEKDSLSVNDTLFLSCIILKSDLPAGLTKEENLGGNLVISNIDSFTQSSRGAVASFKYLNLQGRLYTNPKLSSSNTNQISYLETDTAYNLLVALVAIKKGSYILTFTDVPGVQWSGAGKCGTGNMYFDNNNLNKHLYLFEDKWSPLSNRDSQTSYCLNIY